MSYHWQLSSVKPACQDATMAKRVFFLRNTAQTTDEILYLANNEYEPPGKYYPEGYNLFKKMRGHRENQLLFLHDIRVPPTNNYSERLLRVFKRKQSQVMTFRSLESLEYLCQSMGLVASLLEQGVPYLGENYVSTPQYAF